MSITEEVKELREFLNRLKDGEEISNVIILNTLGNEEIRIPSDSQMRRMSIAQLCAGIKQIYKVRSRAKAITSGGKLASEYFNVARGQLVFDFAKKIVQKNWPEKWKESDYQKLAEVSRAIGLSYAKQAEKGIEENKQILLTLMDRSGISLNSITRFLLILPGFVETVNELEFFSGVGSFNELSERYQTLDDDLRKDLVQNVVYALCDHFKIARPRIRYYDDDNSSGEFSIVRIDRRTKLPIKDTEEFDKKKRTRLLEPSFAFGEGEVSIERRSLHGLWTLLRTIFHEWGHYYNDMYSTCSVADYGIFDNKAEPILYHYSPGEVYARFLEDLISYAIYHRAEGMRSEDALSMSYIRILNPDYKNNFVCNNAEGIIRAKERPPSLVSGSALKL